MEDLFAKEQRIYDHAMIRAREIEGGAPCKSGEFGAMVAEYGKVLRLLRTITKISDRTTFDLNSSRIDLENRAYYDALTGIYNRRYLEENLDSIADQLSDEGCVVSVMMLDVDFFKNFNDLYGHGEGDNCLKAVAKAISGSIGRCGDIAARYGGEEFLVVLPHTGEKGVRVVAERILRNVRDLAIPHRSSVVADRITISIGATSGNATHNLKSYIARSDEALYLSKHSGRNKYTFLAMKEDG